MKILPILVIAILVQQGCSNNIRKVDTPIGNTEVIDSFFPVTSFIKGQLIVLDSLPVTPLQITTRKEKTDSIWLTKEKLKPLLQTFINPVIDETNFTKYFKEIEFIDQTINSVTLTYDPLQSLPDSINLRHWDIYINPETGNVLKVYIVKEMKENNEIITRQLTWKTNKWAKITTLLNKPNGKMEILKEDKFIWDFNE